MERQGRRPMTLRVNSPDEAPFLPVKQGSFAEFAVDPARGMRSLYRRFGDLAAFQDDSQRIHFAFGPEYIKQVLSDPAVFHSRFFAIRGSRTSAQRRLTCGLLSMNGEQHRDHRRMIMDPFQKRAIVAYRELVLKLTGELLDSWSIGQTIDVAEQMTKFMLRLTSSQLFGVDLPELAYRIGERTEHWVALNHAVGSAAFHSLPGTADAYAELLSVAEELERDLLELIRIRRNGHLGRDVLSLLLQSHDAGRKITDEQLIGHLALLFAAAHLTSAHTLTWTLFLLSQHPDAVEKLRDEQQSTSFERESVGPPENLHYLEMVLKESMRVLPASAYSQRIAAGPAELGPFRLQPGAIVVFSQLITHHSADLYVDPDRFVPERWLSIHPGPYEFLPFGAGPRMCLGSSLAMLQFQIVIPEIIRRFELSVPEGTPINARVMSTMLFPDSPVWMHVGRPHDAVERGAVAGNIHEFVELPQERFRTVTRAA